MTSTIKKDSTTLTAISRARLVYDITSDAMPDEKSVKVILTARLIAKCKVIGIRGNLESIAILDGVYKDSNKA